MSNLSGLTPLTIQMTDTLLKMVEGLKPGQVYQAVVKASPQGLNVQVGNIRIALPPDTALLPGQPVTVQRPPAAESSQIIIRPTTTSSPAQAAQPTQALDVLARLLRELPALMKLSPEQGAALVPKALPSSDAVIRLALHIFQLHATVPEAVDRVVRMLNQLVAKEGASPVADRLLSLLSDGPDLSKPESIAPFLKRVHAQALQSPLEGAPRFLSTAGTPMQSTEASLYLLLGGLRNDDSVRVLLESPGALKSFQQSVDTLMEHTAGQHVQNARALEIPYAYLNIPFSEGEIRQAQIHIFGDGGGQDEWNDGKSGRIVLDLETSRLGALWIDVQHSTDACSCRIEVASDSIAVHINSAAAALADRLEASGFSQVSVVAYVETVDRMSSIAELFQRYSGLDLQA